nr:hypothetical protein [Anaerolineae bacterium]
MTPIEQALFARYKYLLVDAEATVLESIAFLRDEQGHDWWYLVVESDNTFAAAPFSSLAERVKVEQDAFLQTPLHALIGSLLVPIETIAEPSTADYDATLRQAGESQSGIAIIIHKGECQGILVTRTTRSGGLFDTGIIQLAGQYAELPEAGLLNRSRLRKKGKKPGVEQTDSTADPAPGRED